MNWTYKVENPETSFINTLRDGEYKAEIKYVQRKESYGKSSIVIEWRILEPEEYLGQTFLDRFYVEHDMAKTREMAKWAFNNLCSQVKELPIGEDLTEEDLFQFLVGKTADITLTSTLKNGVTYVNAKNRTIVDEASPHKPNYGVSMPVKPDSTNHPILNDEVPF